jgi:hypothetical protein
MDALSRCRDDGEEKEEKQGERIEPSAKSSPHNPVASKDTALLQLIVKKTRQF